MKLPRPCSRCSAFGRGTLSPMWPLSSWVPGACSGSSALAIQYLLDGVDDGLVAGAAAVVSGNMVSDLFSGTLLLLQKQILSGHQHSRRAEAALQRVLLVKGLLQRLQLAGIRKALDGVHPAAVRLHGEHQAAAHDIAVDPQGACAAHPVLAADVRAREAQLIAQEVDEVLPRRNATAYPRAVHDHGGIYSVFHARSSRTLARWSLVAE